MGRITSRRRISNAARAARIAKNSTADAASSATPVTSSQQPPIVKCEAIDNSTSMEELNYRLLLDQIDHNAAVGNQRLQFAADAEQRLIGRKYYL
jgi:hypothetical protein